MGKSGMSQSQRARSFLVRCRRVQEILGLDGTRWFAQH